MIVTVKRLLLASAALSALALFCTNSTRFVLKEDDRFDNNLERFQTFDSALNEDVLKARAALLDDYDSFPVEITELKRTLAELNKIPAFIPRAGQAAIHRKVEDLSRLVAEKERLLESFKSQNAVLNNSLRYLPVLGSEISSQLSSDVRTRDLAATLDDLVERTLGYGLNSNEEQAAHIRDSLARLQQEWLQRQDVPRTALASAASHVNSILLRKPKLDALTRQMVALPTGAGEEDLRFLFDHEITTALQASDHYRLALQILCALLLFGVGWTIRALRNANKHLDRRVRERTHELELEVAERRRTEEERDRFFAATEDLLCVCGLDGNLRRVNPAFEKILGWTAAELLAKPFMENIHPDDREALAERIRISVTGVPTVDIELRCLCKDGAFRRIAWTGSVPDQAGLFYSCGRDITDRHRAEMALRSSEERFREFAETIRDVFWITSADCRELLYLSPGYAEIWGRSCASVQADPQSWYETILPEDRASVAAGFEKATQGEAFETEYRIARPDGAIRSICTRGFPVRDDAGILQRIVGVSVDITERMQMAAKLVEAGKLETVGRLAGGIAHDFNTILTTIIGHAELLGEALPKGGPESQGAEQIGKSAARAAQLTQQLLAFSRKQMLQPEILDLNATVVGAELILRRLLGESIDVKVAPNAREPWAKADAGQIQQMLVQLALNAQDAMPRGGRLTLETGDITLDESYAATRTDTEAGEYVMIAITDTGAGIADDVKARLFEPFFTTKPQGEGTGLGLSMCYGIAKQAGGHIAVYSEIGRGTTFKIFLPRIAAPLPAQVPTTTPALPLSPTAAQGNETILLVEDDDALREMAAIVLRKLGYAVHLAANGQQALSIAAEFDFDLVLTDVVMPLMSGKELADRLKLMQRQPKVLFTSAYTENAIVHHGILEADVQFLHKPYTPSGLARKVREALCPDLATI